MNKSIIFLQSYLSDQKGATAIEYVLIAAGVALAIAVIVFTLGDSVEGNLENISTTVSSTPR